MSLIKRRLFTSTAYVSSHVGSAAIFLTPETNVRIDSLIPPMIIQKSRKYLKMSQAVSITGPKGEIKMPVPDFVHVDVNTAGQKLNITVDDASNKLQKSMWGTIRSHINNHVIGVNEGHLAFLKFVGTGYRAQLDKDGKYVAIKVGASIPQGLDVPNGIKVTLPVPTSLIIEGCDKQQVMLFAASIRRFHPPEPYKGKGIYVNEETIKLKNKKIK
ncbi:hypothetical protein KAFR_0E02070 [Kazachstania africana CBS 2517]|uniref:Large ribosomal subunit protein uL6m n=1 Tax=Kazachstania africana (strain ATCC 22294 / BCRC 22015 / CBS 2517 / CECT 1963 / NBRC 1671 / NRRL Y-8276) TaxID=1071382 RepID=H2AVG0_KAZAF|nr:hypothetical protein KAFR_0E02070 [Kazachstania africana CBS 2517]CCF58360.1 hypothetical protein KAFR_0E02070 [Kazachstania africana CBS 2517]